MQFIDFDSYSYMQPQSTMTVARVSGFAGRRGVPDVFDRDIAWREDDGAGQGRFLFPLSKASGSQCQRCGVTTARAICVTRSLQILYMVRDRS